MYSTLVERRTAPRAPLTSSSGMSLERLRQEAGGRLDLDLVLRVADVLLFHIDHAHKRGVRFPKLHASGIALLPDGSLVIDPSGEVHARAPEGEATANEQTDVFEVGALLFYLLAGVEPRIVLHAAVPSLGACRRQGASFAAELPWHVERAIERALHPRRAVRWLDVAELRDALFGDESSRRTLPVGFQRPEWAKALMDRAHASRMGATR